MSGSLADKLELWGFEQEFIVFADGSIGFGLEVGPIDIECWDVESLNEYAGRTTVFLNGLPPGTDVQFIQEIKDGNSSLLSSHKALVTDGATPIATSLCNQRTDRLNELDCGGQIPKHSLKVFVRKPPIGALLTKPKIFSKTHLFSEISESRLSAEVESAKHLLQELVEGFKSLDLHARAISQNEMVALIYQQWNPGRGIPHPAYDPDDVRSGLLFTDACINQSGFSLGEMHYRVLSLKLLPDQTFSSMARTLRGLPFDSRLYLTIHVPDQQNEIESLETQRRIAFSMARGKTSGVSDIDSDAKFRDVEALLEEMIASGEKVFQISLNIVLRSTNPDDLNSQVPTALLKIRELSGAEGMAETLASFDVFTEFCLPNARAKQRMKRIKTSNLVDLLPIYGPWQGHEVPRVLLRSRMGSLVSFDPFAKELSNYNHIVSGGSGSGKSFLTNILLLQMLKENPRIFIIDIGGSYKKLCENLSGQYVLLGVNSQLSLNPFDLNPGDTVASSSKIKFLVGLVELMSKEEGDSRLPRYERAELEQAILRVYESGAPPNLSALKAILMSHTDPQIRRLGVVLGPWCGDTPYGRFVDRVTNISLEKPIVSFDLKGMESYPDLQSVALFIITDFVWREAQRDRSTQKFLVLDECWKLLENESGAAFIAEVFRTFRKYFAGAIAISQNIDDFAKSKVADAILTNCSVKWILKQKGADQRRLQEVLQLNNAEMELIASIRQERGRYSEVFLLAESQHSLVAIEPTPLEYWIATTDPRDLSLMERYEKANPDSSKFQTLNALASQFPLGATSTEQ